jgi:predicted nucleotidyltransferase
MLTPLDNVVARELRRRFAVVVSLNDFRVYGSRARGDATIDSDFDVYVLVEMLTPQQRQQIDEIAWEVGLEYDRVIAPVVATREQPEQGAFGANPLRYVIEREGIVV